MRLIDADELKKQCIESDKWGKVILILDVVNAPTIDIAEVCGECNPYNPCIYCKHEFENKFETCGERREP